MKRFDIETYSRSTLKDHTLTPKNGAWQFLSDKLDQLEHKKRLRTAWIKAALFIAVFIYGVVLTKDSSDRHGIMPLTETNGDTINIQNKNIRAANKAYPEAWEKTIGPLVSENSASNHTAPKIEDTTHGPNKALKRAGPKTGGGEKMPLGKILANQTRNLKDFGFPPKPQVTDAEIDALMRKARENIRRGRAYKHEEMALSPARSTLAHTAVVEEEDDPNSGNLSINNIFREFMKIKSTFAN